MGGGVWMNNGFTCHGDVAKDLPDWWVQPAPVKLHGANQTIKHTYTAINAFINQQ